MADRTDAGKNRPNGLIVNFWPKERPKADVPVTIEFLEGSTVVRTLTRIAKRPEPDELFNPEIGISLDSLNYLPRLDFQISCVGGMSDGADARPTAAALARHKELQGQLKEILGRLDETPKTSARSTRPSTTRASRRWSRCRERSGDRREEPRDHKVPGSARK